jgi:hypothetical protein
LPVPIVLNQIITKYRNAQRSRTNAEKDDKQNRPDNVSPLHKVHNLVIGEYFPIPRHHLTAKNGSGFKSEARSTKSETIANFKNPNFQNKKLDSRFRGNDKYRYIRF